MYITVSNPYILNTRTEHFANLRSVFQMRTTTPIPKSKWNAKYIFGNRWTCVECIEILMEIVFLLLFSTMCGMIWPYFPAKIKSLSVCMSVCANQVKASKKKGKRNNNSYKCLYDDDKGAMLDGGSACLLRWHRDIMNKKEIHVSLSIDKIFQ